MTIRITEPLPPFLIPEELLTFEPKDDDVKMVFKNGDFERKISTQIALDKDETRLLRELEELIKKEKVDVHTSMRMRMPRYISHARGDLKKAMAGLLATQEWRLNYFNPSLIDTDIKELLDEGLAYFCGRDAGLRPILVIRVKQCLKFEKKVPPVKITQMFCFLNEYALRYLYIPGKVESQVIMVDLVGCGVSAVLGTKALNFGPILGKHYVGTVFKIIVVNSPTLVSGIWAVVKKLLSDRQQNKVFFSKAADVPDFNIAKHQLEEQYGGTRKAVIKYYPFDLPAGPFDAGCKTGPNPNAMKNCHLCVNRNTSRGRLILPDGRIPALRWSQKPESKEILLKKKIIVAPRNRHTIKEDISDFELSQPGTPRAELESASPTNRLTGGSNLVGPETHESNTNPLPGTSGEGGALPSDPARASKRSLSTGLPEEESPGSEEGRARKGSVNEEPIGNKIDNNFRELKAQPSIGTWSISSRPQEPYDTKYGRLKSGLPTQYSVSTVVPDDVDHNFSTEYDELSENSLLDNELIIARSLPPQTQKQRSGFFGWFGCGPCIQYDDEITFSKSEIR